LFIDETFAIDVECCNFVEGRLRKKQQFCLLCVMEDHIRTVFSGKYQWITPIDFLSSLSRIRCYFHELGIFSFFIFFFLDSVEGLGDFLLYNQEDAHEFISTLLNRMHQNFISNAKLELEETRPTVPFATSKYEAHISLYFVFFYFRFSSSSCFELIPIRRSI
jgi:hypothetical protein